MEWAEFLETVPPGTAKSIEGLARASTQGTRTLKTGDIRLHCDHASCGGVRIFRIMDRSTHAFISNKPLEILITYTCSNCLSNSKTFALSMALYGDELNGTVFKIGEIPPFGPPLPARICSLIGPDRELFFKGRRAESQGMGVGAFAYYRQVVENQTSRFIDQIIDVAKRQNAKDEILRVLEAASKETQYQKAISMVKSAIPGDLLIDGHNPMMLLHDALSKGLHAGTDEECLDSATAIRLVLTQLSERITEFLKDQSELKQAVSKLLNPKQGQGQISLPSPKPESEQQ